jgi:CubicO group peptidase (beta-lactamase class C family)
MNQTIVSRIATAFLFLSLSPILLAQPEKAEAEIKDIIKQYDVMGISVAVVKNNKLFYTHSFGLKDAETNQPLTDSCLFRIASISKSFSATSIMQLAGAKKLSLDDDIGTLIGFRVRNPKYPGTVITLRMVMAHRSSINDSQGYFSFDAIDPSKSPDWSKCYNDYEPGKGYMYCNLNYNMVGAIIEKVSGERFDQYVKRHILDPLGLYGGYCVDSLDQSRFATIYDYDDSLKKLVPQPAAYAPRREQIANYVMGYSTPVFSPTGGMKISASDLARYMIMHMNYGEANEKRIMKKKFAKKMQKPLSEDEGYGLAIMSKDNLLPGKIMKGHTGSAYGLFSAMFFQPKEKFGIVVITNGCKPGYTDGINTVIRRTLTSLYETLIATSY